MTFVTVLDGVHSAVGELEFNWLYMFWAFLLGGLSAVSLPLGSALGLAVKPRPGVTAALTAFGGGALFCALAIELVAPTAAALTGGGHDSGHGDPRSGMIALIVGMAAGGILFYILDQIVNANGGFLRRTATTIAYLSKHKAKRNAELLKQLSSIDLLRKIPPDHVALLVDFVHPRVFEAGDLLFEQHDKGDQLYFVTSGAIDLISDGSLFKTLTAGDVVGEIALLSGAPRTATARAHSHSVTLALHKQDFDTLRERIPELAEEARTLASSRVEEIALRHEHREKEAAEWAKQAINAIKHGADAPTPAELREASEKHGGAPLAIWLGILLDGIPESFVIGASFLGVLLGMHERIGLADVSFLSVIPYTLIAGLFLSNFPEAMSSSIGMRAQGWGRRRIFVMWMVLMVMTAAGAAVGYVAGESLPETLVIGVEGLAAGAMLTMIVSAMLPEAVHLGGPAITGLSTLMGFLSAVAFKLLE